VFDFSWAEQGGDRAVTRLFADGGVVKINPSPHGGTWAWCGVNAAGEMVVSGSGKERPKGEGGRVTNNHTELLAAVEALRAMPHGWTGELWTDSYVTITRLGRLARGHGDRIQSCDADLLLYGTLALRRLGPVRLVHVKGHASVADLKSGTYGGDRGKRHPRRTSRFNSWCDEECGRLAKEFEIDTQERAARDMGPGAGGGAGGDPDLREVPPPSGEGQGPPAEAGPDRLEDGAGSAGVHDGGEAVPAVPRGPGRVAGAGPAPADVPGHNGDRAGQDADAGAGAPDAGVVPGKSLQRKARRIAEQREQRVTAEECPHCGRAVPCVALHVMACPKAADFGKEEEEGRDGD
jgi:ribonuclease HI